MTASSTITRPAAQAKPSGLSLSVPIAMGIQAAVDIATLLGTGMLCWFLYLGWTYPDGWDLYLAASLVVAAVTAVIANFSRLYDFEVVSRPGAHVWRLLMPLLKAFLLCLVFAFSYRHIDKAYSRIWAYLFFGAGEAAFLLERQGVSRLICRFARQGRVTRNLVIVGSGAPVAALVRLLAGQDVPWVRILGVFDDREERRESVGEGVPILGRIRDLVAFSRTNRVDDIFVALPWGADSRLVEVFEQLREIPANLHLVPEVAADWLERSRFIQYFGVSVLNVVEKPIDGWNNVVKWLEDKVIALAMVVILSPILLLAALAIRLDSRGPILFCQKRLGFNNKVIQVYKFRTMYHEARDENADCQTTKTDPRVTRVGRFLRRFSIDELPQLFNVLKGEMSLVGPRPHALSTKAAGRLFEEVVEHYAERHKIKPGITGWAQVNGWRGETDTEEKIRNRVNCDLFYMENWSLFLDFRIMIRTIAAVLLSKEAY
jgi:Undecaprenyl-phosphate glucose phosphotransferase